MQRVGSQLVARRFGDGGQATAEYALVLLGRGGDRAPHRHLGDVGRRRRQGRRPARRRVLVDQEEHLVSPPGRRGPGDSRAGPRPSGRRVAAAAPRAGGRARARPGARHPRRARRRAGGRRRGRRRRRRRAGCARRRRPAAADAPTSSRHHRATKHHFVRVQVHYTDPTDVPIIGRLLGDVQLWGSVSMRLEPE